MSAADGLSGGGAPSSEHDELTLRDDTLTAFERTTLADYVQRAREIAFPDALGVAANRIGASDQQDFYFRLLLDRLTDNIREHGVPAVAATIDDLWWFIDERFDSWRARRKRRLSRETVRQVAVHFWPEALQGAPREADFDTRAFDHHPEAVPVHVQFAYRPPTESAPLVLSATITGFVRESREAVTVAAGENLPPDCFVAHVELAPAPTSDDRKREYAIVLVGAVLRLLPDSERTTIHELRRVRENLRDKPEATKRRPPRTPDADTVARLQAAVTALRDGSDDERSVAITQLAHVRIGPVDLRHGHDLIDELEDVPPEARATILASLKLMVRGARIPLTTALMLLLVFLLVFISPTRAGAAMREFVQRLFDRIVVGSISDVTIDPKRNLFVTRDGRAAPELQTLHDSWLQIAPSTRPGGSILHLSLSQADQRDLAQRVQFITPLTAHLLGLQYRMRPNGPVIPWVAEIDAVPPQDDTLAYEAATREATVAFTVTPALERPAFLAHNTVEDPSGEFTIFVYAHEFPHRPATYSVTARLTRPNRPPETYSGTIRFDEHGTAMMTVPTAPKVQPVHKLVVDLTPSCTTLVPTKEVLAPAVDAGDVAAAAVVGDEQRVTFSIMVAPDRATDYVIDFGDGSAAVRRHAIGPARDLVTHGYREGDRAYTLTIYYDKPWNYVFQQKALYVFAQRPRTPERVYAYATPYEPVLATKAQELIRARDLPRILYKQPNGRLWAH